MFNTIRSKQVIIIATMLVVAGFLFTRDVKGLVKPKEDAKPKAGVEAASSTVSSFTIEDASASAKDLISANSAKEISALESAYKSASGSDQLVQAKQLAQKWDDVEQAVPSAMYLEVVANNEPSLTNWLEAGTRFLKGFDNSIDNDVRSALLLKANASFTKAMAIDSTNTDAKTGLGITIVNGMGAPMEGIMMLREVVAKEPKNLKANMNLGVFAIKSGQFDKAITRFNTIITTIKATPDAYFYLATAYEKLGKNTEAIDAFLMSKKLAANPKLSDFIDKKVAELKN
ncbi:tetratricopeptide repeat protein [Pedobacter sp. Du54]|uniref:tetratricopeptide repeat protein n=1 Tax=Pedobacter anseongensis TaxID=3133439 RepID=UPI0030A4ACE1